MVPNSFQSQYENAFAGRLEKLPELGFENIYSDEGQTILFHFDQGGLCSLDKTTCAVNAVFYDYLTGALKKADGVLAVQRILSGKNVEVTYHEHFSYLDLPLVSKRDEEVLPKLKTTEGLLGNLSREQVEQFENTGYVLNVDCRWIQPLIANSVVERAEARASLID